MTRKRSSVTSSKAAELADDFTRIKGIGSTINARLHRSGVHTFAQLASSSPEKLATFVKSRSAHRIAKENWVGRASQLATIQTPAKVHSTSVPTCRSQHYETFTVELLLEANNMVRRTRVTHIRSGHGDNWAGWQDARLLGFLMDQAGLPISKPEPVLLSETAHAAQSDFRSESIALLPSPVTETGLSGLFRVSDFTTVPLGSDLSVNSVQIGETFNVCVVMDLTEVKRSPEVPLSYTATIWAKKFGVKSRHLVGERAGIFLPADKVPCAVQVVITSQGIYRLEALVTLTEQGKESQPQHRLMATQASDLLQVL